MDKETIREAIVLTNELAKVQVFLVGTRYKTTIVEKAKKYFLKSTAISSQEENLLELNGSLRKKVIQMINEYESEIQKKINDL